jgi:hypothetical protein
MVLNASYVCLYAFLLRRESPDLDPGRRTPHFWCGSVTSTVTSMTQHLHRVMTKLARQCRRQHVSVSPSPAGLGNVITSRTRCLHCAVTKLPQQHRHQQDSSVPSSTWLNSTITSTTRHRHHTTSWSSTSTIYDFRGKQTRCQLIPILFTIMFGSRANASIPMGCLAPLWRIYVLKTRVWRL